VGPNMKKPDLIAALLAMVLVGAFIGAIVMLSWRSFPESNEQLLTYMLGQLSGFVAGAVGVYFSRRADSPPSGTSEDPLQTQIVNKTEDPVPTTEEHKP
jgi:H+/Cl- antiporter ClcA